MQNVDLARVADELYALSPDDFRAARDQRAAQARAEGDKDLARAITALRRPVVSAWLVNLLAREAAGQMSELLALGESLRDAQQALAGDRLRELSARRRALVADMVSEAKRFAARDGRTVSLQVEREVEATLQAALADPDAAAAVSSGRLASPLSYAGLGTAGATVVPLRPVRASRREGAPPRPAPVSKQPSAKREMPGEQAAPLDLAARRAARQAAQQEAREAAAAERREREAAAAKRAAEQAVQDATDVATAARTALDDAERVIASARAQQETLRQRAEQLDRELTEALAEQSRANRSARDAQRSRDAAARALDTATKQLARARERASRLS